MSPAENVVHAFLYVADKRPVLVFEHADSATALAKQYPGAEVYHDKTHVFLPTPYGLELVLGGPNGETAFQFHYRKQAEIFLEALKGHGVMYSEGEEASRTVFVGQKGIQFGGGPIYPGVA